MYVYMYRSEVQLAHTEGFPDNSVFVLLAAGPEHTHRTTSHDPTIPRNEPRVYLNKDCVINFDF